MNFKGGGGEAKISKLTYKSVYRNLPKSTATFSGPRYGHRSFYGIWTINQITKIRPLFRTRTRDERAARFIGQTRNPTRPNGFRAGGFEIFRVDLGWVFKNINGFGQDSQSMKPNNSGL